MDVKGIRIRVLVAGAAMLIGAALAATPAAAGQRVYAGAEREALVCAHLFAASAVALEGRGVLSRTSRDSALTWTTLILNRYVSGSFDQKVRAMQAVGGGRAPAATLTEFTKRGRACLKRFPV
jgi:hypothetical protein